MTPELREEIERLKNLSSMVIELQKRRLMYDDHLGSMMKLGPESAKALTRALWALELACEQRNGYTPSGICDLVHDDKILARLKGE